MTNMRELSQEHGRLALERWIPAFAGKAGMQTAMSQPALA